MIINAGLHQNMKYIFTLNETRFIFFTSEEHTLDIPQYWGKCEYHQPKHNIGMVYTYSSSSYVLAASWPVFYRGYPFIFIPSISCDHTHIQQAFQALQQWK